MAAWWDEVSGRAATALAALTEANLHAVLTSIADCDPASFADSTYAVEQLAQLAAKADADGQDRFIERSAVAAAQLMARATTAQGSEQLLHGSALVFKRVAGPRAALRLLDEAHDLAATCFEVHRVGLHTAVLANRSGEILRELGELDRAQWHYERALASIAADEYRSDEFEGVVRNNLGLALQARGDLEGARVEFQHSLSLSQDPGSIGHAFTLDNLGSLELDLGLTYLNSVTADNLRAGETLRLAQDYFGRAQQIFRRHLPDAADDLVFSLNNSAQLARTVHDDHAWSDAAAEASDLLDTGQLGIDALWQAAVLTTELEIQNGRPDVALQVLGWAADEVLPLGASGQHLGGLELFQQLLADQGGRHSLQGVISTILEVEDAELEKLLTRGSERGAAAVFHNYRRRLTNLLGVLVPAEDGAVDTATYEVVLDRKGLLAQRKGHTWLRSQAAPELAEYVADVRKLRAEVSRVDLDGSDQVSIQAARRHREEVALELDRAEARLMQALAADGEQMIVHWSLQDLTDVLNADELLVDVVTLKRSNSALEYAAFLIRPDDEAFVVRLGTVDAVDEALTALVDLSRERARRAIERVPGLLRLSERLDARRLIFAPIGAWCGIPLGLFPVPGGLLIDDHLVTTVPSARWLIERRTRTPTSEPAGPPVVLGGPDFDLDALADLGFLMRWKAEPLPHSRSEAEAVAHLLGVTPVLDAAATRARLLAVRRPRILHVATHGKYLDARNSLRELSEPREYQLRAEGAVVVMQDSDALGWAPAESPGAASARARHLARLEWLRDVGPVGSGARSAILLAGFNAWLAGANGGDPYGTGLVTAGEFAMLDLSGTELVVLSACESGVGAEESADGSQAGLRADALAAGAGMCVSSLWNVNDKVTADLMVRFYRQLATGVPPAEALRLAQLEIRAIDSDPRQWAAWLAEGT